MSTNKEGDWPGPGGFKTIDVYKHDVGNAYDNKELVSKVSQGLRNIGLTCDDNTPEKVKVYMKDVISGFPTLGSRCKNDDNDYNWVIDTKNAEHDKMLIMLTKINKIQENGLYEIYEHNDGGETHESAIGTIKDVFKQAGKGISQLENGHIDVSQLGNMISDWLTTLTTKTEKDYYENKKGPLFLVRDVDDEGHPAAISGLVYD
ncbi:hypothetical protein CU098_006051, partial [Rhizopus stolonifer]